MYYSQLGEDKLLNEKYFKNKRDLTEIAKPNLANSYDYFLG